jgi:hypothetical protein
MKLMKTMKVNINIYLFLPALPVLHGENSFKVKLNET